VGQTSTSVDVNAGQELINDTKTDVSNVVGQREIADLPINGRRVDSFVLNVPGVTNDGTFGLLSFRGIEGNNSFLLDGNDNVEQYYDENAGRTRIQSQVSATPCRNSRSFRPIFRPNTDAPWRRREHRYQERNQRHPRQRVLLPAQHRV